MTVISKELFYKKINKDVGCEIIHYWTKSCIKAPIDSNFCVNIAKGAGIFFLPVFLLRMFLDYRRKRKNIVKRFINNEIRAITYGLSLASVLITFICFFRKVFGRFYYYALIFIPAFLSGPSLLIVPYENQILNTLLFSNSFIETQLNKLKLSAKQELFLFMGLSGILMQLFENRSEKLDFSYFWFYTPSLHKINPKDDKNNCHHDETCKSYLSNGIVNYFLVGYGINVTKSILSKFKIIPKNPLKLLDIIFNRSNANFGIFIGAYVGLYRYTSCYLQRTKKLKEKWHGLISGALAGISYTICPTLQVSVLAITTILQMVYHIISKKMNITNHFYQRLIIFSFTHAYNLHNKFFFPDTSSAYYYKMVDACSNDLTKKIYDNLITKYFG